MSLSKLGTVNLIFILYAQLKMLPENFTNVGDYLSKKHIVLPCMFSGIETVWKYSWRKRLRRINMC